MICHSIKRSPKDSGLLRRQAPDDRNESQIYIFFPARRAEDGIVMGANAGTRQWRDSAAESPMSKGAFGYTDSQSDHCELRQWPLSQDV